MTQKAVTAKFHLGNPEWEAMKARRRNVSHHDAVQESARITTLQWRLMGKMAEAEIDLYRILRTLIDKKIPFVLTGTHGIGGWTGRPRATHDIDILVKGGRNLGRAVKAISALYPGLEIRVFHGVTGFFVPGTRESVIDVTYPHRADNEETLAHPVWTNDKKLGIRYRIPALENALANKYGAMLCQTRDEAKRIIDTVDFTNMVRHSFDEGQQAIDLQRLELLGEMVWPSGGGKEILGLVDKVKAGGVVKLDALLGLGHAP